MRKLPTKVTTPEDLHEVIDSLEKLYLVLFFHENPETLDNVSGISLRLGYSPDQLVCPMAELADAGVLTRYGEGDRAIYIYPDDPILRQTVEREYCAKYRNRESRKELESAVLARRRAHD